MPVGFHQPRRVDVRIIASTNRDLRAEVEAGRFRQDLYFRINVFSVTIPPLRERPRDILPLAEYFPQAVLHQAEPQARRASRLKPGTSWKPIHGPAMCANCRMRSNASSCWPSRRKRSARNCSPTTSAPGRAPIPPPDGNLKTAVQNLEDEMIRDAMERLQQQQIARRPYPRHQPAVPPGKTQAHPPVILITPCCPKSRHY